MSILKDLNPEIRRKMDEDKELYNHLHAKMVSDMQRAFVVTDLQVNTANILIGYGEELGMEFESNSFILKLYQIFGK
jgi:predicted DsbA family dithiol-disulfide isomerase